MSLEDKIISIIHRSIDEINEKLSEPHLISKEPNAILFGRGNLDSVNFLSLILSIEGNVSLELSRDLNLLGEDFLMEEGNAFSSIQTLSDYIKKMYLRQ